MLTQAVFFPHGRIQNEEILTRMPFFFRVLLILPQSIQLILAFPFLFSWLCQDVNCKDVN